ncbi:MAG: tyrosine--tRNA ligase [Patescibacteria group bacterium]
MKLSEDLAWRGLIKDKTFTDETWLDKPQVFYHGVDASSDSLTIGNLAALLLARRLTDAGWKAMLLVGGATSLIGDPGGKTAERELQSREEVSRNVEAIKKQVSQLFAGQPFIPADNYDWFADVKYLDFLRDVGKHYSMTELMQRDFVTERMGEGGSGISYAEFSYSLIQGYDYWQLHKRHGAVLQIGGSDQWGNMLSGASLIRKKESAEAHALSMPLVVNKETGQKFGKSEAGAIWLDPAKTSPTQFYQFWINVDDADVENYLKVFTLLPKEKVEQAMAEHKTNAAARKAQKVLAEEVTMLVHGEDAVTEAKSHANFLVSHSTDALKRKSPDIKIASGTSLVEALIKTGLADSNTEARRLIDEKGVYVNNEPFSKEMLEASDFTEHRLILRRGKKLQNSVTIELE